MNQDDINSENQREEKILAAVSSGDRLKLSSKQSPNQNLQLETCMKNNQERGPENHWGLVQHQGSSLCPLLPKLNFLFIVPYSLAVHGREDYRD